MIKNINDIAKTLGFKILIIVILGLLLLIPMSFINGVVRDRIRYQDEAVSSIIEPVGNSANIQGVVIAIPYLNRVIDSETKEISYIRKYIFYMPNEYNVEGNVEVSSLSRGIFKAPIFNSKLNITGRFDKYNAEIFNLDENNNTILYDEAMLILGIVNKKNLMKLPNVSINQNEELQYYEKNINISLNMFSNKFLYTISRDKILNGFDFNITMDIQGGNSLIITPLASENTFKISSKWKDPSFTGGFLPTKREVNNDGFNAEWNIASFNTAFTKYWTSDENANRVNDNEYLKSLDENMPKDEARQYLKSLSADFMKIGHVPYREKDKVFDEYKKLLDAAYDKLGISDSKARLDSFAGSVEELSSDKNRLFREREKLMRQYEQKRNEVKTYENNLGFFNITSKSGGNVLKEMERRVAKAKEELSTLEKKIEMIDEKL